MFSPDFETSTWWGLGVLVLFYVLALVHVLHALMNTRTSQGTIARVACLLTIPFLAIPLYWLLGRSKFSGYVHARRGNDKELRKIADSMYKYPQRPAGGVGHKTQQQ